MFTKPNSDDTDSWVLLDTFFNVSSTSYTVNGVGFDETCRLIIATNCINGGPSEKQAILEDKIVLDLIVAGRVPLKPVEVACTDIFIHEHEWIGFEVKHRILGPLYSNLFEVQVEEIGIGDSKIHIMRVSDTTVVYAVNDDFIWPIGSNDTINVPNPFKLAKLEPANPPFNIGRIRVIKNSSPSTINICKVDINPAWNPEFEYTVYVSDKVVGGTSNPSNPNQGFSVPSGNESIRAQSPFTETLKFFTPFQEQIQGVASLSLFSTLGERVLINHLESPIEEVFLSTENLKPGIYFLVYQVNNTIQTLKVVKN